MRRRDGVRGRRPWIVALVVLATSAVAGACGTQTQASGPSTTTGTTVAPAALPPAFANGTIKIALVRQLAAGDFYQQYLLGAQQQAGALHLQLQTSDANGDDAQQAVNMQQAINNKPDAIVVDHGFAATMDPVIDQAINAGIPVVAFDVSTTNPKAIIVNQDDAKIAQGSLNVLESDTHGTASVIYCYVAGYAPLDARNQVWEAFKQQHPGIKQVAQVGVVNSSTPASTAVQVKAALQAHPDVTAVFAPYDDFAKGATQAIQELGLQGKVKVYGADTSTADLAVMTAANSPWVASTATDPANVGRASVRAAALLADHDQASPTVIIPPLTFTSAQLNAKHITTIEQLRADFPGLTTPQIADAPWMQGHE